jgi:PAS domain S-box-containing protein
MEQEIKNSEERFRLTFENAADAIFWADSRTGLIINCNKRAEILLERSKEEIIGSTQISLHPPQEAEYYSNLFKKYIEQKGAFGEEATVITKSGKIIPVSIAASLTLIGEKPIVQGVFRDITDLKDAEQELIKSKEKYRNAYNQADFYRNLIAHDINNILQVILSTSEFVSYLLKTEKDDLKVEEELERINKSVKNGANLISNVRTLSTLEESQIENQPIEALAILKNTVEITQKNFKDKKVNVELDISHEKIIVQANELIRDVFANIMINAVKHNDNSTVEIMIKVENIEEEGKNFYKFNFLDNGMGVSDDNKEKIFQRGAMEGKSARGMGLGLSLVKKIIDGYNGQIWVEDKEKGNHSKGSNFIILIPQGVM